MKSLRQLLDASPQAWKCSGNLTVPIAGVQSDSRKIKKGDLFIAVNGLKQDGEKFIQEAVKRGAAAVVCQKSHPELSSDIPQITAADPRSMLPYLVAGSYDFPERKLKCIGITGTNGKTTTAFLIHYLLNCVSKSGLIGTVYHDNTKEKCVAGNTTPAPEILFELLSQMVKNGASYCVMEVSSHALDQNRTDGIHFSSAVFTNLTQDHLDYHHDFEQYFQAKRKLFFPDHQNRPFHAVINQDDPYGKRLLTELAAKTDIVSYGTVKESQFIASNIKLGLSGTQFDLTYRDKVSQAATPMILKHNVYNVLAALAALSKEGFNLNELILQLRHFPGVPGRLEKIDEGQDFFVFVDYAHTPDGLFNVLSSAQTSRKGRIISVFGCGGDRDKTKRPLMGEVAERYSDVVIVTTDNPRSENPDGIISEIKSGFKREKSKTIICCPDRAKAIEHAVHMAQSKDLVFIFGKGHEHVQIVGSRRIPFSDQEYARKTLRTRCSHSAKSQPLPAAN